MGHLPDQHPDFVFTYHGKRILDIKTAFRRALRQAGITDYRWHDNRHTWASILIQNGVPLHELQEMGGWKPHAMVERYAHNAPEALFNAATRFDKVKLGYVLATYGENDD